MEISFRENWISGAVTQSGAITQITHNPYTDINDTSQFKTVTHLMDIHANGCIITYVSTLVHRKIWYNRLMIY